jgi:hypothetical protein
VRSLLTLVGEDVCGPVKWRVPPGFDTGNKPGVYLISMAAEADALAIRPDPDFNDQALSEWLARCPAMMVDDQAATLEGVKGRLREFWLPDETVLYIGKVEAGTSGRTIRQRVGEYYRTSLGATSPHRGGAWLKTLADLDSLSVYWAPHAFPLEAERDMVAAFAESTNRSSRLALRDSEHVWPFANVRLDGVSKRHGMKGMTA